MIQEFINKNFKIVIHLSFCPPHFGKANESEPAHCKAYDSNKDSMSAFSSGLHGDDGDAYDESEDEHGNHDGDGGDVVEVAVKEEVVEAGQAVEVALTF